MSDNGVEVLAERLHEVIELTMKEWNFTVAEVIGAIEVVKLEVYNGRVLEDESEADNENNSDL